MLTPFNVNLMNLDSRYIDTFFRYAKIESLEELKRIKDLSHLDVRVKKIFLNSVISSELVQEAHVSAIGHFLIKHLRPLYYFLFPKTAKVIVDKIIEDFLAKRGSRSAEIEKKQLGQVEGAVNIAPLIISQAAPEIKKSKSLETLLISLPEKQSFYERISDVFMNFSKKTDLPDDWKKIFESFSEIANNAQKIQFLENESKNHYAYINFFENIELILNLDFLEPLFSIELKASLIDPADVNEIGTSAFLSYLSDKKKAEAFKKNYESQGWIIKLAAGSPELLVRPLIKSLLNASQSDTLQDVSNIMKYRQAIGDLTLDENAALKIKTECDFRLQKSKAASMVIDLVFCYMENHKISPFLDVIACHKRLVNAVVDVHNNKKCISSLWTGEFNEFMSALSNVVKILNQDMKDNTEIGTLLSALLPELKPLVLGFKGQVGF